MKKCLQAVLLIMLLTPLLTPLSAVADGESCETDRLFSYLRQKSDVFVDEGAYEVDRSQLFYEFPYRLEGGEDVVELEFRLGAEALSTEAVAIVPEDEELIALFGKTESPATGVVAILAAHSAERARLDRLAATRADLDVEVRLNGELVEVLPFGELRRRSEELRTNLPLPHAISSRLLRPGAEPSMEKPVPDLGASSAPFLHPKSCTGNCDAERDGCYLACHNVPRTSICMSFCDNAHQECLDNCANGCQARTTTTQTSTLISQTVIEGLECLKDIFTNKSNWYDGVERIYRVVRTTTTVFADCRETTTTETFFVSVSCYRFRFLGPCSFFRTTANTC